MKFARQQGTSLAHPADALEGGALLLVALLALLVVPAGGCGSAEEEETPPDTDIYVARLSLDEGHLVVAHPINLTNRPGYDDQPMFLSDGTALLYTSIGQDDQADTYRYDLIGRRSARLTRTAENEYSPTLRPGHDGFSVVRVEPDGKQRLWAFDATGQHPVLLLEEPEPVGYHAWGDATTVALFILGDPPTLHIADTETGTVVQAATSIGRSMHKVPGRRSISFVDKQSDEEWWIREIELPTRETRGLIRTLPDCEDHAWTPDGNLLMPCQSRLYLWRPGIDAEWRPIADFADVGMTDLSRVAVSPNFDQLALVNRQSGG